MTTLARHTQSLKGAAQGMKATEFILFAASTMLLTAAGSGIVLPAFGAVREHFDLGADSTAAAQIIVFFFVGQIGQILFGSLSDKYGRLVMLRAGFLLYIGGGIAAALAPGIYWMYATRFIAGIGSAALWVSIIASVRDRFSGDRMARTLSFVLSIFLLTPVVAPLAGSAILSVSSWQAVFLAPPLLSLLVLLWSIRLGESLPPERRVSFTLIDLARSARGIIKNKTFVRYTLIAVALFGAFSSYISSSERIVGELYGRSALFVWIFAAGGVMQAVFTFSNAQLATRFGSRKTMRGLLVALLIVALVLLVITLREGLPDLYLFFGLIAVHAGLNAAIEPNTSALALEPMGEQAGLAAALHGTSIFVIGAASGSVINLLLVDSVLPLVVGYVFAGLMALALAYAK